MGGMVCVKDTRHILKSVDRLTMTKMKVMLCQTFAVHSFTLRPESC